MVRRFSGNLKRRRGNRTDGVREPYLERFRCVEPTKRRDRIRVPWVVKVRHVQNFVVHHHPNGARSATPGTIGNGDLHPPRTLAHPTTRHASGTRASRAPRAPHAPYASYTYRSTT